MGRRLNDLFVVGRELEFDDGSTEIQIKDGVEVEVTLPPLTVWVQKLHPFHQEQAMARAQVERAKVGSIRRLPEDAPQRIVYENELDEKYPTVDSRVLLVSQEEMSQAFTSAESEVAFQDEWSKEDYLVGLQDAWESGIKDRYQDDNDDEAQRVFNELKRYQHAVEEVYEKRRKIILRDYGNRSDDELRTLGVEKLINNAADLAWFAEYKRCEVWLAVREERDHNLLYFKSREEVDTVSMTVLSRLLQVYNELNVPPLEGKD